jgi:calcineurin-like phosphoesterase family protein
MGRPDWLCQRLDERRDDKWDSFSWITLRALASSANDVLGKGAPRLVTDLRRAWVARVPAGDRVVRRLDAKSFVVVGDPGEQDASEYAVAAALEEHADVDFMLIASDVIYPAGDVNDYVDGFYVPYAGFKPPIYAIPGNHDWYDSLFGFMWNFCGEEEPVSVSADGYELRERLAKWAWRKPRLPGSTVRGLRDERGVPGQPGPYFALDLHGLRVVCIDTGIKSEIDCDQARWLLEVSRAPGPKLLVTGKPLVVNGRYEPCPIARGQVGGFRTVDQMVRHKDHGYIAAIGGDVHNYQRYPVTLPDKRQEFYYLVSGGGGAYMGATHTITERGRLESEPEYEEAAAALTLRGTPSYYPDRVGSLIYFSRQVIPRLWRIVRSIALALAAFAAVAAVMVLPDVAERTRETWLTFGALGLAGGAVISFLTPGSWRRGWKYRAFFSLEAIVFGGVLALTGWWLARDSFETSAWTAGGIALGGAIIALLLRGTGWWRCGSNSSLGKALVGVWAIVGLGAGLVLVLTDEFELAAAVAVLAIAGAAGGWLRTTRSGWSEKAAVSVATGAQAVVALLVVYRWPVREAGVEREFVAVVCTVAAVVAAAVVALTQATRAAVGLGGLLSVAVVGVAVALFTVLDLPDVGLAVVGTVAWLLGPILVALGIDALRRWLPQRIAYKGVFLAIVAAAAVAVAAWPSPSADVLAAGATIMGVTLLGVAVAHLTFLDAYPLLWRCRLRRDGSLTIQQATQALHWRRNPGAGRPDQRTRQIVNMVHPGSSRPRGPLHRFVAEIFDSDEPPFAKSFLRVEVEEEEVRIECHGVTGEQEGSTSVVETTTIRMPARVAGE